MRIERLLLRYYAPLAASNCRELVEVALDLLRAGRVYAFDADQGGWWQRAGPGSDQIWINEFMFGSEATFGKALVEAMIHESAHVKSGSADHQTSDPLTTPCNLPEGR